MRSRFRYIYATLIVQRLHTTTVNQASTLYEHGHRGIGVASHCRHMHLTINGNSAAVASHTATTPPPSPPAPSSHYDPSESVFSPTPLPKSERFQLTGNFLAKYATKPPPFGYNGLGELVYLRTYSRTKDDGTNEQWYETVARVVNGTYTMQKQWIDGHGLGWNARKAQTSAQEMFDRIFNMKFLPPGRGLWAMGSPITEQRGLYAALNNCAFVSTENLKDETSKPFTFLMDASMLGVGVGFDTKGANAFTVRGPAPNKPPETYVIPDTREGWVDSLRVLLDAFFHGRASPVFDYSKIRPFGTPIKGFGGVASGPEALGDLLQSVRGVLETRVGQMLSVTDIVDIMNLIGRCVVAGNVRRTAEIAFGEAESVEYLDLKNYQTNPKRAAYGWTSNNSVFATVGMDYTHCCDRIRNNGEPGFAWLDNMRNYGRMDGTIDKRDHRAKGGNPCLEQTLESYELCCLVETFPHRHTSLDDFQRTLKFAYLYAKTVTLGKTQWPDTNRVLLRNRRIGCSVSGVAQFISQHSLETLRLWLEEGYATIQRYDQEYSDWLAIPRSIKTTSVKPSGTVSLLAGATPGMHYPESRYYIRRVRLATMSPLLKPLINAGYHVEPVADGDNKTSVVSIPIDVGVGVRVSRDVSMWEQLALAAFLQRHWADNQVSCTVTFDPMTEGAQLEHALNFYQYQLKGISFLPRISLGAYKQMPYEEIDGSTYDAMVGQLKPVQFEGTSTRPADATPDRFCDGDVCSVESPSAAVAANAEAEISAQISPRS